MKPRMFPTVLSIWVDSELLNEIQRRLEREPIVRDITGFAFVSETGALATSMDTADRNKVLDVCYPVGGLATPAP